MRLFAASYRAWHPGLGTPVVTSFGLPKWLPEAKHWPRLWVATPQPPLLRLPPLEFSEAYLAQLQRFGPQKISRAIHRIAEATDSDRLVFLCHEHNWAECHRFILSCYLLVTTGELITELALPERAGGAS